MADDIKKSLKERSKLAESYYKNDQQKSDYNDVMENFADCTKKITHTKNDYINKINDKLKIASTALKTYWDILNCLLYNKKIPAIPPLLADGKFVQIFVKKQIFLIIFYHLYVHQYKIQVFYPFSYIGQMPE